MAFPRSLPPALHPPPLAHRPLLALDQALLHRLVPRQRLPEPPVQLSNLVNRLPQIIQGQRGVRRMAQKNPIGGMEDQKLLHLRQAINPQPPLQSIPSHLLGLYGIGLQQASTPTTKNLRYP